MHYSLFSGLGMVGLGEQLFENGGQACSGIDAGAMVVTDERLERGGG